MVCRWAQEFLSYQFSIKNRIKRMMAEVDALTRIFGTLIAQYCMIASILHHTDKIKSPEAYNKAVFNQEEGFELRIEVQ